MEAHGSHVTSPSAHLTFIAKVGFGRKPAAYPARAESRFCDMALKLSKMV